ncbi:hypothetical protein Aph02nite_89210 [Actinoplanes philippinensis]|uniref:Glycosyl transferase family 2 n=1 Tax=Actinoplanes philippinensis TaxID=35752 RepID=A0A1I2HJJ5_9ACTN|nr:DUF6271 family protein [Actinoplanes philippinensis]GIE82971.1 hypothetical protein Aph02nite_89210 [Actinoplanes philippinensis]SFF29688.1 hypothetical protein SAMN05421541_108245 [Actinoplanes philippinensis]
MKRRICLVVPTNRECTATLAEVMAEAEYAERHHDADVRLLVLDSSDDFTAHAKTLADARAALHLDEPRQREFLRQVVDRSGAADPGLLLDLLLPARPSYGACTNRAFLIAAALGCESVHRRDSDLYFQTYAGEKVFPIHAELSALGRPARNVTATEDRLDDSRRDLTVAMAGASFVGDMSVDVEDIRGADGYYDLVSLWAAPGSTEAEKRALVEESFTGSAPFAGDHWVLSVVDPMRVDMHNISFHGLHERVPLPPATDTIGSDYFLIHVADRAGLPGLLHNRHIVNFHTGERKTDAGFLAYQMRFAKFILSMYYFHFIYERMTSDDPAGIAAIARASTWQPREPNEQQAHLMEKAYRRLGGRFTGVADRIAEHRDRLLVEARRDIEDFATLIDAWAALVAAARETPLPHA